MKVLVVDDHPVVRDGLATLLRQVGPGTAVLEAGDAAQALALVAQHADLDIVVLDIVLPGLDGLRAIAEFGRARPELPVIVLSSAEDAHTARRALAHGALGFVPKSASRTTLLAAVRLVMSGEIYVPALILDEVLPAPAPARVEARRDAGALTDRQVEVLRLVAAGRKNLAIAVELGLSEKTVKAHVTAIFKAMNVVNRTQAANLARELGLI
ncbi:MAG TPA: response regulator transcription factor [Roseiarcus sp.]|jgi:DNA-binding NarL/FixJ family response regulator